MAVLEEAGVADDVVPVTYMNSSAAIKGFAGRHDGTICTSSNAKTALTWALAQRGDGQVLGGTGKVLFLPDQHLGRNTYVRDLGGSLDDCVVFDPHRPGGGLTTQQVRDARMILWRGHCSVHGRFSVDAVSAARREIPGVKVIVHPECTYDVVEAADEVGSTEKIIKTIAGAPDGTSWVVGTELNLVRRLAQQFPRQRIAFLEKNVCYCSTMNRIDLPPPGLGTGVPRRRAGRQPDPCRPVGRGRGPLRARPDAGPAGRDPQGLSRARGRGPA